MSTNDKAGQYFIAHKGKDLSKELITKKLNDCITNCGLFRVKCVQKEDATFAKIVWDEYLRVRDPYESSNGCFYVSGYNQEEIRTAIKNLGYDIRDENLCHILFSKVYADNTITDIYKKLNNTHFCLVMVNSLNNLIGMVSTPNSQYTRLFYGYTSPNNEIVFSNNKELLTDLCHDVQEMPNNSYIFDGEFYNNDEDTKQCKQLIKNTKENSNSLIQGLNELLVQVTTEAVQEQIIKNVEDYLNSDDPKKQISDYLVKELNIETQRKVLELIKVALQEGDIKKKVEEEIKTKFEEKLEEYKSKIQLPMVNVIKLGDIEIGKTTAGFFHEKFEEILEQVQLDEPVMLIGPAGSGKNYTVQQVADALGLHMYYTNNASNEFKLTGFIDAGGTYRETEFYRAFKNGGLFNLDEIDASDPTALIVINSALANGYMAFPHETIDRHPNFRIVVNANTWGKGADMQYVGRNALDGATLDRFDNVYMDYDRTLEKNLYPNYDVLEFMWAFRDAVDKSKVHHIVSTRGIGKVYKKDINNFPVERTLKTNVVRNLGQDDLNTILGNMTNISTNNKYYQGVKTLRMTK